MRGTPQRYYRGCADAGIIPAYAGNTRWRSRHPSQPWDHPRVCGEHLWPSCRCTVLTGSSPRMRGTPVVPPRRASPNGIIPAYAGNTSTASTCCESMRDHPRVCGEHCFHDCLEVCMTGSSPRMRGTPACADNEIPWRGIIPAYAGNTWWNVVPVVASRDHPRVCGEHLAFMRFCAVSLGSSPRMRGTPGRRSRDIRP